jgi:hypothetical protein
LQFAREWLNALQAQAQGHVIAGMNMDVRRGMEASTHQHRVVQ